MKISVPEPPDSLFQCFTDPAEWAAAKWAATAFLYNPSGSRHSCPGMGLAFENFDAAKQIFDGSIKRLGHIDKFEELRISIIEGPVPADTGGYSVFISSNPLHTVERKRLDDASFDPTTFIRLSRLHRMNPAPGSPHLRLFKKHFAAAQQYRLFPAHFDGSRITSLDSGRYLQKRELNLFHVSELMPHQAEYTVFNTPPEP